MKRSVLAWIIVLLATGCLVNHGGTRMAESTGKLLISASIPAVLQAQAVCTLSVLEDVTLKEIVFTASNGSSSQTERVGVESTEDTAAAAFDNLAVGTWTMSVKAVDIDDIAIASALATASVDVGTTTHKLVTLVVLPGALTVQLEAPSEGGIAFGKASLLVSSHEKRFDITPDSTKTIDFGEVAAQVWLIKAELFNSSADRLYAGQSQVAVLPGRTSTAQVEFDEEAPGGLSITVNWNLPPDKPTGVSASYANGRVSLAWADDGAAGYMVIRGLTEDGHGVALTDSPIAKTAWVDDYDFEPGQTYWYRVIAYDGDGVSSHFSEAASVTMPSSRQASHTVDDVSFTMRLAPAATFPVSINNSRTVSIDTSFWIAETLVTYELWYTVRQWALQEGYIFSEGREGSHGPIGQFPSSRRLEPVTSVSWRDSIVWCNALSEMMGLPPVYTYQGKVIKDSRSSNAVACDSAVQENTDGFRLPHSYEWELAARYQGRDDSYGALEVGGLYWTPGNYASGATASIAAPEATKEVAWYRENASQTRAVGLKSANALGLFDMSGNAYEWMFSTEGGGVRILRGGSWWYGAANLQVGRWEVGDSPDSAWSNYGLRLVRTAF